MTERYLGEAEMRLFQKKRTAVRWLNASFEKTESIRETVFRAALLLPAVLLILFSGVFMLQDAWSKFELKGSDAAFLIAEVFICTVLYGILLPWLEGRMQEKWKKKWTKKIRLVVTAFAIYLLYRTAAAVYWKSPLEMEDGLLAIGNRFMDLYNADHNTSYVMDRGLIEFASYAVTYLLAIIAFLFFNLSYLTRKNGYWTALPIFVWAAELAVGRAPYWPSITFFGVGCYLLSGAGTAGKVGRILDGRGYPRQGQLRKKFQRKIVTAFLILGGMLLFSTVMRTPANNFVQSSRLADTVARWKEERYEGGEGVRLEFDFFAEATKVTNDEPRYRDKKILQVTLDGEPKTNIYLKDFEGAVYQKGEWISRDAALRGRCINDNVDQRQIQHMLNEDGYGFLPTLRQYRVKYFRLERDVYPLPYFIDTGNVDEDDFTGDVLIRKSLFQRKMSFSGPGSSIFSEKEIKDLSSRAISQESDELWNWYDSYVKKQYLTVSQEIPSARRLADSLGGVRDYQNHARTNQERWQAAYKVSALLQRSDYSWDLEELEKGTDPVEYFLATGKKGYCVHFASAGVMILRAMGVPARYAEGYILKQQAFSEEEDGSFTAQALDRNRHAWAEIYLNHVGWIPIEMTKGYTNVSAVLQTQEEEWRREQQSQTVPGNPQGLPTQSPTQSPSQSPEDDPLENSEEDPTESEVESKEEEFWESIEQEPIPEQEDPASQLPQPGGTGQDDGTGQGQDDGLGQGQYRPGSPGGTGKQKFALWKILKILLWVCMTAAALLGTVRLVRGRIRAYYEAVDREFARGRYVSMVKRINRRLIAGLRRRRKIAKRYPTDAEYGETLKRQFPDVPEEGWKQYMDIVKEAAFSANGLDEEKAKFCRDIYKKVRLFQRGV